MTVLVTERALTARQWQVLRLASLGMTCVETALELGIGVDTVKDHRSGILDALEARSMAHATAIGIQRGILP